VTFSLPEIHAAVEEAARVQLGSHGRLLELVPVHASGRAYSKVHRMELRFEQDTLDVCLKLHRRDNPLHEEECVAWAAEEYTVLAAVHAAATASEELSVVRPLALLPQLPGILFETHHGTVLNSVLRVRGFGSGRRRRLGALECYYRKLGVSLREFHGMTTGHPDVVGTLAGLSLINYGADDLLKEADDGFERAMLLSSNGTRAQAEETYRSTREDFRRLVAADYAQVGVHGDFTPVNVFIDDAGVTLFDFVNFHRGHAYEDISRWISYTYFAQKDPLSLGRQDVARLTAAFMDGYGLPDWRTDPVLRFFFQKSMFRTLLGGFRFARRPGLGRAIYRRAMLRVFRQSVREGMCLPS
jgi:Phosphotransferase enzyme family